MGYDIYITRQDNWYDEDMSKQISLAEWTNYITRDTEMRLDNFAEAVLPGGEKIRLEKEGLAVWLSYPGNNTEGNYAWFYYSDGNISVKNPDGAIMKKMLQIATVLKAKLQGDDGETYDLSEINKVSRMMHSLYPKFKKPWWKFW
ncbi:MAG: hypothetical protein JST86_12175 [Bacteroidetes bacterium]|nr:hypothetical protein [Bacteroidota bacterium]